MMLGVVVIPGLGSQCLRRVAQMIRASPCKIRALKRYSSIPREYGTKFMLHFRAFISLTEVTETPVAVNLRAP